MNRRGGGARYSRRSQQQGGAIVTPLTIITSVSVVQWIRGDLGITLATGVSAWADQSGNSHHFAQATGNQQPLYTAADATLNNRPTVTGDGANDVLTNGTLPNGAGLWMSGLIKMVTWVASTATWGGLAGDICDLLPSGVSPTLSQFNGSFANANGGLPVGSWGRVEANYANTAAAYLKLRSTNVGGAAVGAGSGTGCSIFASAGVAFANHAIAERIVCSGLPTPGEITALDAYYTARYGAGLV